MATKDKTVWFCTSCGNESPKWMGKCPACGEWNTLVEQTVATGKAPKSAAAASRSGSHRPQPLREVGSAQDRRVSLGIGEVDRLLGGGLVEGSLVLLGGEPGRFPSPAPASRPSTFPERKARARSK